MDVVEFDEVPGDEDASKPDVAPPEFDDLLEGVATTEPKDLTADREGFETENVVEDDGVLEVEEALR